MMKKWIAAVLSLLLVLSLLGCGKQGGEEVILQLDDVHEHIIDYYGTSRDDDNYVDSYVDSEKGVVVVELKDISEEKQESFIHDVFSSSTGSLYIKNLKEHELLLFEKAS